MQIGPRSTVCNALLEARNLELEGIRISQIKGELHGQDFILMDSPGPQSKVFEVVDCAGNISVITKMELVKE